ncbi:uracil-DNA glycosylase family protein [Brachyspira innocens]|uniref:uracil-DNA glycosylase n=1 Tax=Brachyspira innocens TaxID=13264 RepID=UPI0026F2C7EF|nr:uracil-DNA glycosylase [Brachyspira innocens]
MNKIENYFLQHNKIKFSNVVCSQHNKKIILRNPKKAQQAVKKEEKDINKGMESMKEIKNEDLKKIYGEVEKCMKCDALCNSRLNVVFGRGDEEPDIVFVGEAPGADEDKQGLPFVGRGGKLLDKWIEKMNINKEKYYIMNALKCRPPENRDPLPEEKANCRDFFVRQLQILNPKIICALGRHGFGNLIDFDLKTPFGKARNKVHYYSNNGKDIPVIATYHPAYILRNQKEEDKVISDLEFMLDELEKVRNK